MERLEDLEAFLAIVETGGQTAAARHLRRSLQSISRSLMSLERSLGVDLVQRTTRQSSQTEAGLAFYRRIKPALTEINDAKLEVANKRSEPAGLLRVGAPILFAPAFVVPAICDFMERYPKVEVELKLSDRKVDLVEEGLDVVVRIRDLPDSGLKARRLGELRAVVFGSPAYFAEHGRPEHPDELMHHQCVLRFDDGVEKWPFRIGGRRKTIGVKGRFRTNSAAASHVAVARGLGIGLAPLWQVRSLLEQGVVEVILKDFEAPKIPIYAVLPATKTTLAKTRLFTDLLAARLKRESL
jgi:DNA-binding transcriptional LysR family regulator